MIGHPIEIKVHQLPGVAVIRLRGEINAFAAPALESAYSQACTTDPGTILLNFSEVDYINSTGIALIVGLLSQARRSNRRLIACSLNEHYQEIFSITRLVDFMNVYPDEASALASSGPISTPAA
jgi:anti-anti-sigma factor